MNIITTCINSPLEQFEVTNLIGLNAPIFSYLNLSITYLASFSLLVLFILLILALFFSGLNKIQNFFNIFIKICIFLLISQIIFSLVSNILYILFEMFNIKLQFIFVGDQDPIRWWPTGVAPSWGILGGALLVYRTIPGNNRIKSIAALSSLGVTIPMITFQTVVENPNGFNKFMFSLTEYKRTGSWPSTIPNHVSNSQLDPVITELTNEASSISANINNTNNFISSEDLYNQLYTQSNLIFDKLLYIFRPVEVSGCLDDLVGQQLIIYFLLLVISISLIFLVFIYMVVNIFLHNKNFILNKFNNKFIRFMVKYEIILGKISLFIIPMLILAGLIQLVIGFHFLITHPIPYELLPIDLHIYLKK